jgi:hypothetical protein
LDQDLISNRPPPPPAGRAAGVDAGAAAVFSLIYTYILNGGKELDTVKKICPEILLKVGIN